MMPTILDVLQGAATYGKDDSEARMEGRVEIALVTGEIIVGRVNEADSESVCIVDRPIVKRHNYSGTVEVYFLDFPIFVRTSMIVTAGYSCSPRQERQCES
jgi:hypothetical protein